MSAPPIAQIVRRIVDAFHPRRIVMFGSRVRGDAAPESDVDLMVEMESDQEPPERAIAIRDLFGLRSWSMDVFVYTPGEVARYKDVVGTLLYTIEREGRPLYERA